jgi:hypothetical protein
MKPRARAVCLRCLNARMRMGIAVRRNGIDGRINASIQACSTRKCVNGGMHRCERRMIHGRAFVFQ